MTFEEVSATERAASLTGTLPVARPLDESILNRPVLDVPARAHMVPLGCGCATAMSLLGAATICSGTIPAECREPVCGWPLPQEASAMATEIVTSAATPRILPRMACCPFLTGVWLT
jgi:hypothetical protein